MVKWFNSFFSAYWPIGLFAFFCLVVLSLVKESAQEVFQWFGLALVLCGAMIWLVNDYVKESDNRVTTKLAEISDLLAPYDGMKLSQMPPEIQEEVRKRLGWTTPPPPPPKT